MGNWTQLIMFLHRLPESYENIIRVRPCSSVAKKLIFLAGKNSDSNLLIFFSIYGISISCPVLNSTL